MKESIGYLALNLISTASSATETDPIMECEFYSAPVVSWLVLTGVCAAIFSVSAMSLAYSRQPLRRNCPGAAQLTCWTGAAGGLTLGGFYLYKALAAIYDPLNNHCSFSA
jgi:hypothetical protein